MRSQKSSPCPVITRNSPWMAIKVRWRMEMSAPLFQCEAGLHLPLPEHSQAGLKQKIEMSVRAS